MNSLKILLKYQFLRLVSVFKGKDKKKSTSTATAIMLLAGLGILAAYSLQAWSMYKGLGAAGLSKVCMFHACLITLCVLVIVGVMRTSSKKKHADEDLLLSLPIKRKTVLCIRILKFYLFELAYNSLFLVPSFISYAIHVRPDYTYYITSIFGILLFPIIPIMLSCFLATITTYISSKFRGKNFVQTIITFALILGIMYLSSNMENLLSKLGEYAASINDTISKIYYPAGVFIDTVNNFTILKLLEFIFINIVAFIISVIIIGKFYFNINSQTKAIKVKKSNQKVKIKSSSQVKAMVKKEFNRFIGSTVFVINAGFGMVLFIISCILLVIKFDNIANGFVISESINSLEFIKNSISLILFGLICFACFMTSITSSMISLEGKSFNILKSLPIKPYTIVKSKVLSAVIIMLPCIFIGDIIVCLKFKLDILGLLFVIWCSIILPFLTQTIGIIVNLKYPRMDAKNDTEVVKQSISSAISVFIGMILFGATIFIIFKAIDYNIDNSIIMFGLLSLYTVIYGLLLVYLKKNCNKLFNAISI